MPTTYNGIGTRYAGRRNEERRAAACHSCGRHVQLVSYDTRLFFVILYIPIIPLARKRILDECPVCRRHYAIDAEKWETQKQLGISGAMDTYEASPTPEAAMELHQTMLNFHQRAQAAEFRRGMVEKFGENAHVRAYLGEALTRVGNAAEGAPHFARALELRPDLPEARVGVARQYLGAKRLDDARGLLDFLEKPGAEHLYSLEPLEILADSYRAAGQHAPALELYQRLLTGLPTIGQIPAFRKKVQLSEKALRPAATMLPKRKWSWKSIFGSGARWRGLGIFGVVLLLIGAGFVIANESIRRHRTVVIVNATDADTSVIVRGAGEDQTVRLARVRPGDAKPNMQEIVLPEGRYHVLIGGGAAEEFDFEVRTEYWSRWGGDPLWLINVRGAALLVCERVTYRRDAPPPTFDLHFGKTLEAFSEVTHAFKTLPESMQLKSNEERVLTHLDFFQGDPAGMLGALSLRHRDSEALDLAEWAVQHQPENAALMDVFIVLAQQQKQTARADRLLAPALARWPVLVAYHRAYQDLHRAGPDAEKLAAEYDRLLQTEPENSALLYLRGRLGPKGHAFFERALQADPQNFYAAFALGYDHLALGDPASARPLLALAVKAMPDAPSYAGFFWQCRLALGEYDALETEARAAVATEPLGLGARERLIDVLAARGQAAAALGEAASYARASAKIPPAESAQYSAAIRRYALYATGDFKGLQKDAAADRTPAGRLALFQALLEQELPAEAARVQPLAALTANDALQGLLVSVELRREGEGARAYDWFDRSALLLGENGANEWFVTLLRATSPPDLAELAALKTDPAAKAILLIVLAEEYPAQRKALLALARPLNYARGFPHHLLDRLTAPEK